MKKLSILLTLVLVVGLFAGCGKDEATDEPANETPSASSETPSKEDKEPEPDKEPEEMVTMQMLWWSDGIEGDVMQGILDDYKAETGVEIELVVLGYDDYGSKLKTMIRGGQPPALIRATEGHIAEFNNFLLGLDEAFDSKKYTNVYYNAAGETIVLPMDVTSNGLYVNKDLLDKYEVNYPSLGETWTWAEFEMEMEKLKGKEDVKNPGVFDNKAHRYFPMLYQFGGKIWETPYSASGLLSDASVEALETLQRMNTNGTLDPTVWAGSAKPNELFQTGKYGFHMSGNWFVAAYQDLSFNWGVVPMPIGNGENATRSTILGGKGVAAVSGSKVEKEALDFIAYLSKAENHDKFTGGVPFLSPRLGAEIDFGPYQAAYEVFQDEISNTPVENVADWQSEVAISGMYPIINKAVEDAMSGTDARKVLEALEKELMEKAKEQDL